MSWHSDQAEAKLNTLLADRAAGKDISDSSINSQATILGMQKRHEQELAEKKSQLIQIQRDAKVAIVEKYRNRTTEEIEFDELSSKRSEAIEGFCLKYPKQTRATKSGVVDLDQIILSTLDQLKEDRNELVKFILTIAISMSLIGICVYFSSYSFLLYALVSAGCSWKLIEHKMDKLSENFGSIKINQSLFLPQENGRVSKIDSGWMSGLRVLRVNENTSSIEFRIKKYDAEESDLGEKIIIDCNSYGVEPNDLYNLFNALIIY
jgi:hypothetical protein